MRSCGGMLAAVAIVTMALFGLMAVASEPHRLDSTKALPFDGLGLDDVAFELMQDAFGHAEAVCCGGSL